MPRRSPLPYLLGGAFVAVGTMHFVRTGFFESIVPDYLPAHRELVYASGVAEIAGGAGLLHPATRRAAGWWLLALLVAVFPANVWMAQHPEKYRHIPDWALYARLPVQALFAYAIWRAALRRDT